MSSSSEQTDPPGLRHGGRVSIERFTGSLTLKIAGVGLLLLVVAALMDVLMSPAPGSETSGYDLWGLWAGIFGVWGGAMLIVGVVSFVIITWKRQ